LNSLTPPLPLPLPPGTAQSMDVDPLLELTHLPLLPPALPLLHAPVEPDGPLEHPLLHARDALGRAPLDEPHRRGPGPGEVPEQPGHLLGRLVVLVGLAVPGDAPDDARDRILLALLIRVLVLVLLRFRLRLFLGGLAAL